MNPSCEKCGLTLYQRLYNMFIKKKDRVSGSIVVVYGGKVLLSKRSANCSFTGYYQCPGGKIEYGEDVKTGLLRELKEETGLKNIQESRLEFLFINKKHPSTWEHHLYRLDLRPGEKTKIENTEPEKNDGGWLFIKPENALRLKLMPSLRVPLQEIVNENKIREEKQKKELEELGLNLEITEALKNLKL